MYFVCQHDGQCREHIKSSETKIRNYKHKTGSVKKRNILFFSLFVKVSHDCSVTVKYVRAHSHPVSGINTVHHPIPHSLKSEIKTKLAIGTSK